LSTSIVKEKIRGLAVVRQSIVDLPAVAAAMKTGTTIAMAAVRAHC
jgi:hypothetical protein